MKLELEHLAPYLPYELKIKVENGIDNGIFELQPVMLTIQDHEGINKFNKWFIQYESKPLLRPLSDLTKEIEHNGDKFVPIIELYPFFDKQPSNVKMICNQELDYAESHYYGGGSLKVNTKYPLENRYDLIEKLFEWHFDVFNLIENGLAIKKD